MQLRLSKWVTRLDVVDGSQSIVASALVHRLTGIPVAADPLVIDWLESGEDELLDDLDLPADGGLREIVTAMRAAALLVEPHDDDIDRFWNWTCVLPLRNPSVVLRDEGGAIRVYRPRDLSLCRLPRTDEVTAVVRETLPADAHAFAELAAQSRAPLGSIVNRMRSDVGREPGAVESALRYLCHPDRQLVRLVPPGTVLDDPDASFQHPMQSFVHRSTAGSSPDPRAGSASGFYRDDIADAQANFDWVETTVSHSFRRPTAALAGRAYGARLGQALAPWIDGRPGRRSSLNVLEIGGGLGFVAAELLGEIRSVRHRSQASYSIFDLSSTLQERQKRLLGERGLEATFVLGDAQQELPRGQRYDLILANEVIADFAVDTGRDAGQPVQAGAAALVARLGEHLRPGGVAILTEYGMPSGRPERVMHLNHSEFTVDFSELQRVADDVGLHSLVVPLTRLLEPVATVLLLIGQQERYECLRARARDLGTEIEFRVYDKDDPELAFLVPGSTLTELFAPQSDALHFGPDLRQFHAILVSNDANALRSWDAGATNRPEPGWQAAA